MRLRAPSFVPLAVPLCHAQGPLSEASSEPGGPCAHQVHSGLGLSSCLRLWVSALGHLPPGSVGFPIRQEMRRGRVRRARAVHHTLACILLPRAAWPGGCIHRASVSPAGDSFGVAGLSPGHGVPPGWELASRRGAALGHLLLLYLLFINLDKGAMLTVPWKASGLGKHVAPLHSLSQLGFCFWGKMRLPSNSGSTIQAGACLEPPQAPHVFPCLYN